MKSHRALLLLAVAWLGLACSSEPKPPVEPEPPHQPATAPAPVAADVEPTPEQVPIPEDFEEQAEKEVSREDLRAQLDALEQEIARDSL